MPMLVGVYNSEAKCIGWCNTFCYNGKPLSEKRTTGRFPCTCICGGENHGVGEAQALKNHLAGIGMRPQDLERYAAHRGLDVRKLVAIDRLHTPFRRAKRMARALVKPGKPRKGDLFYRLAGIRKSAEDARQRRG